jgi:7,8-dihydropterin-6-yl-methyl-4-(beta-D-ribofuranosyl)aminobenzene 5'-phosphate synthase
VATVEIVEAGGGVKVYAHPYLFLPRFNIDRNGKRKRGGVPKGEGISEIEAAGGKVLLTSEPSEVVPGLWTTGQIQRKTSFEKISPPTRGGRRVITIDDDEVDDEILDDQALWMELDGVGPLVITGCAHAGPINTLLQVQKLGDFKQVYGFIGGTHLVRRPEAYLDATIRALEGFGLGLISPCHCTGFKATSRLWREFPDEFILNFSGRVMNISRDTISDKIVERDRVI